MFFMECSPSKQVPLTSQSIPQKSSRTVLIVTFLEYIGLNIPAIGLKHCCMSAARLQLFYKTARGAYTVYTNQLSGNLVHIHNTIKYEVVGERSALQTKIRRKIASPQVTTHIF